MKKTTIKGLFGRESARRAAGGAEAPAEGSGTANRIAAAEAGAIGSEEHESADSALKRLGEALLSRLGLPEGLSTAEAVDMIISMWEKNGADEGADGEAEGDADAGPEAEKPAAGGAARSSSLPRPLSGTLADAPEPDYQNMSAAQFRALKKQLHRASMNGLKVRI